MYSVAGSALLCFIACGSPFAIAQDSAYDPANYAWQPGASSHAQRMRAFVDPDSGQQPTPPVIPQFEIDFDRSGILATTQPSGSTQTPQNALFRKSRYQQPHGLQSPSAPNRLGRQRSECAGALLCQLWK
jgi:hypothetical protein